MSYLLVSLDGGPDIPTGREPIIVGRHPHCDVRLRSIRVSRRHCCLAEVDGEVAVRDLDSTNGTLINGRRVEAGRLKPGDELSIANLRYRLEPGHANRARAADPQAGRAGMAPRRPSSRARASSTSGNPGSAPSSDPPACFTSPAA
jgi:predicted component of type VI protein secretion system